MSSEMKRDFLDIDDPINGRLMYFFHLYHPMML